MCVRNQLLLIYTGSDLVDWLHTNVDGFIDRRHSRKYAALMLKVQSNTIYYADLMLKGHIVQYYIRTYIHTYIMVGAHSNDKGTCVPLLDTFLYGFKCRMSQYVIR